MACFLFVSEFWFWDRINAGLGNCCFVKDNNEKAVFYYSGQLQIFNEYFSVNWYNF